MDKSLWKIFKDMLCEDNGNGSATRGYVLIGLLAHLYFTFEMVHSLSSIPTNVTPGNVAGITAYFVGGLAALAVWKVSQKVQEEKITTPQSTNPQ